MKKKILVCLMILTLIIATGCGETSTGEDDTLQSAHVNKINITINPEANLITDDEGIVTEVEYLNEDAETAYADLNLVGLSVSEATELMTQAAAEKGFLVDGKPVTVSLVDTAQEGQDTLDELTAAKEGVMSELNNQGFTDSTIQADVDLENIEDGTCDLCYGSGVYVCDACNGTTYADGLRWTVCEKCSGSGQTLCTACFGEGIVTCDSCGGTGLDDAEESGQCHSCNGTGKKTCYRCTTEDEAAAPLGYQVCEDCKGEGKLDGLPCYRCGGSLWMVCPRCNGTGHSN